MADVKIQVGIKFLDKDVEVGAITRQVQKAINAAIAQTDLSRLKKKFAELEGMAKKAAGRGAGAGAAQVKQDAQAYDKQAAAATRASQAMQKMAIVKAKAAATSPIHRNEIRLLDSADLKARELGQAFQKAGVSAEGFGVRIAEIGKRFSGFFVYTAILFKFLEALRFTTNQMKLLDQTAADLAKVLKGATVPQLERTKDALIGIAVDTKRAFNEVAEAMVGFVRQGLDAEQALEATRATMELMNTSSIEAATAQKLMTTLMNSMGLEASDAREKLNAFSVVADNSASTIEDLAAGFSRAGSTANAFGISTEQLSAMIGEVVAVTQLSATRVGTAFKTILSYTAGNREALLELAAGYRGINKSGQELAATHKNVTDVLKFVSQGWNELDAQQKVAIGRLVGGKRRFNELAALMGNFGKVEELLIKIEEGHDEVRRKSQEEMKTLAAAHRNLGNAITGVASALEKSGITELYKTIINTVTLGVSAVTGLISALGSLGVSMQKVGEEMAAVTETDAFKQLNGGLQLAHSTITTLIGATTKFVGAFLNGALALRNALLILFVRVLAPWIKRSYDAFKAFITGSARDMKKLIDSIGSQQKAVIQTTQAYDAQVAAVNKVAAATERIAAIERGRTAAVVAPGLAPGGIGGGPAPAPTAPGAIAPETGALLMGMNRMGDELTDSAKAQEAVTRGLTTYNKRITVTTGNVSKMNKGFGLVSRQNGLLITSARGLGTAFSYARDRINAGSGPLGASLGGAAKGGKTFLGSVKNLTKGMGGQLALTFGLMQGLGALSNATAEAEGELRDVRDGFGAAAGQAVSTTSKFASFGAAFGPLGALIGGTVGSVVAAGESVADTLDANAKDAAEWNKVMSDNLTAQEALTLATKDRYFAEGLVQKGFAEWKDIFTEGGRRERQLEINWEQLPGLVSAADIRGAAFSELKTTQEAIVADANKLRERIAKAADEIQRAATTATFLRNQFVKASQVKFELSLRPFLQDMPIAAKTLGRLGDILADMTSKNLQFTRQGFEFRGVSETSAAVEEMRYQMDLARKGAQTSEEAIANWKEQFGGVSGQTIAINDRIKELRAEYTAIEERAKSLKETIEKNGQTLSINVDGASQFAKALALAEQEGVRLKEDGIQPTKEIIDRTLDAVTRQAGATKNLSGKQKILLKTAIQYSETLDEQQIYAKLLEESGGAQNEEAKKLIKNILELINLQKEFADLEIKSVKTQEATTNEAAKRAGQLLAEQEIIKAQNEALEYRVTVARESVADVIATQQARQRELDILIQSGQIESTLQKARREAAYDVEDSLKNQSRLLGDSAQVLTQYQKQFALGLITAGQLKELERTITLELKANLAKETEENIKRVGDLIKKVNETRLDLEKERASVVRNELESIAEAEKQRLDIAKDVTESFAKALTAGGLSDAEAEKIIAVGPIKRQLSTVNNSVRSSLNLRSKIQLAHALESVDIESEKTKQEARYNLQRTTDAAERIKLRNKIVLAENKRLQDRSSAIASAMKDSVVRNFELMAEGTRKATAKMREIREATKQIAQLRAQVEFAPPEDLRQKAARKEVLQARDEELQQRLEELQQFNDRNKAILSQRKAIEDANQAAREQVLGIKRQLGLTLELTNAFGQIAISSETAANVLVNSEDSILRVRTENAQAALSVYQAEFNKLKSFGQQLYTASPVQIRKLAQANAILQNSSASMAETLAGMPMTLRDAAAQILRLRFGERGEQFIAEAGLARAGVGGTELERLQQKIVSQADAIGQEQVRQTELQQRTADGMDFAVTALERQIAQNQRQVEEAEKASTKIDEMREAVGQEAETPRKQLREAIERRKLLRGQLTFQQRQLQQNLAQFGVTGPGVNAIRQLTEAQTKDVATSKDHLQNLRDTTKTFAESLARMAEAATQQATVQLDETTPIPLDTENLGKVLEQGFGPARELSGGIDSLKTIVTDLQSSQQSQLTAYDSVAQKLDGSFQNWQNRYAETNKALKSEIGRLTDAIKGAAIAAGGAEGVTPGVTEDQLKTAIQAGTSESNRQVHAEAVEPTQAGIKENTLRSAEANELFMAQFNELKEALVASAERTATAMESVATLPELLIEQHGTTISEMQIIKDMLSSLTADSEAMRTTLDIINDTGLLTISTQLTALGVKAEEAITAVNALGGGSTLRDIVSATYDISNSIQVLSGNISTLHDFMQAGFARLQAAIGRIRSSYGGLTPIEMAHVVNAAKIEKSRKPIGSDLVMANSSELVMTPEQAAKVFSRANMTDGTGRLRGAPILERGGHRITPQTVNMEGAENVGSLLRKVDDLMGQQSDLVDMAKKRQLLGGDQNINIDVAGKREITVKGVAELSRAVEDVFKKEMGNITTKAEHNAVKGLLEHIVKRIKDAGIDGVY
jgi:TP901 family phage tail tape measure protein